MKYEVLRECAYACAYVCVYMHAIKYTLYLII